MADIASQVGPARGGGLADQNSGSRGRRGTPTKVAPGPGRSRCCAEDSAMPADWNALW